MKNCTKVVSSMSNKAKILVLVEGSRTDVRLMEKLLSIYGISSKHQIVSYNTNIYALYNSMFKDTNPEDMDLLQVLKEQERDVEKKKIFDEMYSDILLIFDLDPQDPSFTAEKIVDMIKYFDNSSDMGKLYLNYPMVEAFYHMKGIPDEDYNGYTASMEEVVNKKYKERVQRENRNQDYSKFAVDKKECNIVIRQNIEKANIIVSVETKEENEETLIPTSLDILLEQLKLLEDNNMVSVLCTCAFYIPEYNAKLIIED